MYNRPHANGNTAFSVRTGGQPAQILFFGLTSGFLGLAQANVVRGVVDGDAQFLNR